MIKDKDFGFWVLLDQVAFVPIPFHTITSMGYTAAATVPFSPTEEATPSAYNVNVQPLSITLGLSFQGEPYIQAAVLLELRVLQELARPLMLITPSGIYMDMVLSSFSFTRDTTSGGADLLNVSITLSEVYDADSWFSVRNRVGGIKKGIDKVRAKNAGSVSFSDVGQVLTEAAKSFW